MADNMVAPPGKGRRIFNGPRGVGDLVRGVSRNVVSRGQPGIGHLLMDWPTIVGPALATVTEPRQLFNGSLTIGCAGPIAMELQHMAPELMSRINTYLGGQPVRVLRFAQGPIATGPRVTKPHPRVGDPAPVRLEGFPDGPLKEALERLGGRVSRRR
jgi:hypothetical protein